MEVWEGSGRGDGVKESALVASRGQWSCSCGPMCLRVSEGEPLFPLVSIPLSLHSLPDGHATTSTL